ncbi:MAG: class I SAM-dependent methyltransferase [Eubacteriales bacterium]
MSLSGRLDAIYDLLRPGASIVDIGTDHALLPIHAALNGRFGKITATDKSPAPLSRARQAAERSGVLSRLSLRLCDGLQDIEDNEADDIVIAGMGGELIRDILTAAPHFYLPDKRFILQPMSRDWVLREYLSNAGFPILREVLVKENGRLFVIIHCRWDGLLYPLTRREMLCGRYILDNPVPHREEYLALIEKRESRKR